MDLGRPRRDGAGDGRAAAPPDPAPGAHPRPHPVRPGQGRGQLRRGGDRLRRGRRPLRRRGRRGPDQGQLRPAAARRRHRRSPGRRLAGPRRRPRQRRRPDGAGERRRARGDRPGPPHALARPDRRALRVHADGGPRHRRPLGPRRRPAHGVDLHPDLDRCPRGGRRQARPRPGPGRRHHPRRRRRLRRQDQPPLAGGAARPAGGARAGEAGEVHRGPARALHLLGPRARPGPPHRGRLRRRGPPARARRGVLARPRRLHAVRPDRPDHHLHPAARPLQAAELPGGLPVALHQHRDGHALPRRRAAAGLLRHGADDGRDRGVPRQGPHRGALGQLHPARRVPLRPGAGLPGRPRAEVRLRRLPGLPGEAEGAGRLGRVPGVPCRDGSPGPHGRDRPGLLRRGHRRGPLRGRPRPRRDLRQGQGRHRSHHPGAGPPDGVRAAGRRRARAAGSRTSR